MTPSQLELVTRVTIGSSLLICAALLSGSFGGQEPARTANPDFLYSTGGVEARLHTLRHMEKQMLAEASRDRASVYQMKRDQARRRIDELMLTARAVVRSSDERKRLGQLAAQTERADRRMEQVQVAIVSHAQ